MAKKGFDYKPPGAVARAFMLGKKFFRGIRGPVGSGKSVACCVELWRAAAAQEPSPIDGKRYTRGAIIRNTNPQLKTTTIKTWLEWFEENIFGKFIWSVPYTHHIKQGDIDAEFIFLALDRPEDVRKLLSLDLTFAWVNEAREVPKTIIDAVTMRVGRYPSKRHGGPTRHFVIADTNAPEDDHWWPIMAGESPPPEFMPEEERLMLVKPENWEFYTQPSGMLEQYEDGKLVGYEVNPLAENYSNLPKSYYPQIIGGKTKAWIDVYVMNRLGNTEEGKPVYPSFRRDVHVAKHKIGINPHLPVYTGTDFGLTPATIFAQQYPDGQWAIFREIVMTETSLPEMAAVLNKEFATKLELRQELTNTGDPAGDARSPNDKQTAFQIFRAQGIVMHPAPTNDPVLRISTVTNLLNRMVNGKPGLIICPTCTTIIKGFESGYHYKRVGLNGETKESPNKNRYSHPHDALQYLFLGAGEGAELVRRKGQGEQKVIRAKKDWNVWERRSGLRKRAGSRRNRGL